jgi:molecular chaperone GrpE (heat shock protein)
MLEVVEATTRSVATDGATRDALELVLEAAWARLEAQGVVRDGAAGEVPDLTRHRVVRERRVGGGSGRRVSAIVEPGLVWRGRRLRPAAVVVEIGEESDGQDRD